MTFFWRTMQVHPLIHKILLGEAEAGGVVLRSVASSREQIVLLPKRRPLHHLPGCIVDACCRPRLLMKLSPSFQQRQQDLMGQDLLLRKPSIVLRLQSMIIRGPRHGCVACHREVLVAVTAMAVKPTIVHRGLQQRNQLPWACAWTVRR